MVGKEDQQQEGLDAQLCHHPHGVGNLGHGVALVVVEAALHAEHGLTLKAPDDEPPLVAGGGTFKEVGQFLVGNDTGIFQPVPQRPKPGPQHQADFRLKAGLKPDITDRLIGPFQQIPWHPRYAPLKRKLRFVIHGKRGKFKYPCSGILGCGGICVFVLYILFHIHFFYSIMDKNKFL